MTNTSKIATTSFVKKAPTSYFYDILNELRLNGKEVKPRGQLCKEIINYSYQLPPYVRFMCFDVRKLNPDYIKQEFLWYVRANKRDVSIRHVAKMWDGLINYPDGTINSNYGPYIFGPDGFERSGFFAPAGGSNIQRVARELIKDPDSRRASICILNNTHLNSKTNDYPCTAYLNFLIRDNQLHMFVRMRSQDAIYGMGNDAPCFSFTHEILFTLLQKHYPDLEMGWYHHSADSFHIYEKHYEMLESIIFGPTVTNDLHESCPKMVKGHQLDELTLLTNNLMPLLKEDDARRRYMANLSPFGKWLIQRDNLDTILQPELLKGDVK